MTDWVIQRANAGAHVWCMFMLEKWWPTRTKPAKLDFADDIALLGPICACTVEPLEPACWPHSQDTGISRLVDRITLGWLWTVRSDLVPLNTGLTYHRHRTAVHAASSWESDKLHDDGNEDDDDDDWITWRPAKSHKTGRKLSRQCCTPSQCWKPLWWALETTTYWRHMGRRKQNWGSKKTSATWEVSSLAWA